MAAVELDDALAVPADVEPTTAFAWHALTEYSSSIMQHSRVTNEDFHNAWVCALTASAQDCVVGGSDGGGGAGGSLIPQYICLQIHCTRSTYTRQLKLGRATPGFHGVTTGGGAAVGDVTCCTAFTSHIGSRAPLNSTNQLQEMRCTYVLKTYRLHDHPTTAVTLPRRNLLESYDQQKNISNTC